MYPTCLSVYIIVHCIVSCNLVVHPIPLVHCILSYWSIVSNPTGPLYLILLIHHCILLVNLILLQCVDPSTYIFQNYIKQSKYTT